MEGKPPNSHVNLNKVLFIIPTQSPPKLKDSRLSRNMHDFVKCCLVKSPKNRMSAEDALRHAFISNEREILGSNEGTSTWMSKFIVSSLKKKGARQRQNEMNALSEANFKSS